MFRFIPNVREDEINDESSDPQSYVNTQHIQFQNHDIPEVVVEQVDEEQEEINEDNRDEIKETSQAVNDTQDALIDRQNELMKELDCLKIQFQKVVQERNQEVRIWFKIISISTYL